MSLLYPLFLAGIAAVALPIVFHLIRRTPTGRTPFSSLMFLRPSPPRLARRKRLDQVVLLSLRALALALLALAFARPYRRAEAQVGVDNALGPRIALLVDTSASMRRPGLWTAALREVDAVFAEAPSDAVFSLATFDRVLADRVGFDESLGLGTGPARTLVRERLTSIAPTWAATDLGGALATLVDGLDGSATSPSRTTKVVLVSDVQEGSDLAALEAYGWPEGIRLEVRPVRSSAGNASLHPVPKSPGREDDATWVRVANCAESVTDRFRLQWASAAGDGAGEEKTIACPPGESRVVRAPERPTGADIDRLVLDGDVSVFDDVLFDREPVVEPVVVPFLRASGVASAGTSDDGERGLEFFLAQVFEGTDGAVTLAPQNAGDAPGFDIAENPLVLLALGAGDTPPDATIDACLRHAAAGGVVLAVLEQRGEGGWQTEAARVLGALLDLPGVELAEASTAKGRFALLGEIDFAHPLFAPFSDPRFSDFTKIRFWRHRVLELAPDKGPQTGPRVVARFDDGAPFLVERVIGPGRVFVAASGWSALDSDLALSSKFAPLLLGMLRLGSAPDLASATFHVGDRIPLPRAAGAGTRTVRRPDGTMATVAPGVEGFTETELPGHYEFEESGRRVPFTIHLDPGESRVDPLEGDRLARLGVPVVEARASDPAKTRQEQSAELEQRQKLWRFLIVLALSVLMVETVWAGRLARRPATPVN